jgi:transcriptional regulator with XRE-family HTH domain
MHKARGRSLNTGLDRQVGANIRRARQAARLSQDALAVAIGVDRSAISRIERGLQGLNVRRLQLVALALGVGAVSLNESESYAADLGD